MTKAHWENIYSTKQPHEVSWTQEHPKTSLDFIHEFQLPLDAGIIDVGGGESRLVDRLLDEGFGDITVLDISESALERTRSRLGNRASKVHWVVSDITTFRPERKYTVWHDRATFHFLTEPEEIGSYLLAARTAIAAGGFLIIGTFSDHGPTKCSGLPITQYSERTLEECMSPDFEKIRCITEDHQTPSGILQNFLFCGFKHRGHRDTSRL